MTQKRARRKHKNSKWGCPNCKRRRIKCTEELPQCGNCVKHKEKCLYLTFPGEVLERFRAYKASATSEAGDSDDDSLGNTHRRDSGDKSSTSTSTRSGAVLGPASTHARSSRTSRSTHASGLDSSLNEDTFGKPCNASPARSTSLSGTGSGLHNMTGNLDVGGMNLGGEWGGFSGSLPSSMGRAIAASSGSASGSPGSVSAMSIGSTVYNHARISTSGSSSGSGLFDKVVLPAFSDVSSNSNVSISSGVSTIPGDYIPLATTVSLPHSEPNFLNRGLNLDYNDSSLFDDSWLNLDVDLPYITRGYSLNDLYANHHELIRHTSLDDNLITEHFHDNFFNDTLDSNYQLTKLTEANDSSNLDPNDRVAPPTSFPRLNYKQFSFIKNFEFDVSYYHNLVQYNGQDLSQIKQLYLSWLKQFIHRATTDKLYFNCLMTLTTNYLTCTKFNSSINYMKFNHLFNHTISQKPNDDKKLKTIMEIKSINYFNPIIQDLSKLLGQEPDLSAQVSYVLLLLSVYHHDATLGSVNCFRDGLFSILQYNNTPNHKFIHVQLNLIKNSLRSVFLPSYNIEIVKEFQTILTQFHQIVKSGIDSAELMDLRLVELLEFVELIIKVHYPIIANNLANMNIQQEELFKILYKWTRSFPGEYIHYKTSFNPLQLLTFLFYNSFKKMLYGIFPQIKFFFLRDFESSINLNTFDLTARMAYRPNNDRYFKMNQNFQFISNYLIRLATFLDNRLILLNRILVTNAYNFPIHSLNQWKLSINNIDELRQQFVQMVGLEEVEITHFADTIIKSFHYPKTDGITPDGLDMDYEDDVSIDSERFVDQIDFGSITSTGFLEADFIPNVA